MRNLKIGIEVHVQLNTKSKLFCSCSNLGSDEPNSRTCATCLGHPGSKPILNKEAFEKAIKVAIALGCKINNKTFFSRKSYFYPDLAKNFQISQYEIPVGLDGKFEGIGIRRLHLEEDPAALIHKGNTCLIDYNRSGTPLIEIVTEPDFKSPNDVRLFLRKMITMLTYLDVYYRKEESTLKADANISVHGERVEIKNINGLKEIERALEYEAKRQETELQEQQETRGWDSEKGKTYSMRVKESEDDYGYIFEPDLPLFEISKELMEKLKKEIPELGADKSKRYRKDYKLDEQTAEVISNDINLAELYEYTIEKGIKAELAAKWLRRDLLGFLSYDDKELKDVSLNQDSIVDLLKLIQENKITDEVARKLLLDLIKEDFDVKKRVKKEKLEIIFDEGILEKACREVIKENSDAVEKVKKGDEKVLNFLMGHVMKKTKGVGRPDVIIRILKRLI